MILVTVGTNEAPFDRLLQAVGSLSNIDTLVVQHGASAVRPSGARCIDFLPYEDLLDLIREAQIVIMHAGVGSVMTALGNGKRPIVVPRLRRYGEAVDDHQLTFARAVGSIGLVSVVEDPARLADMMRIEEPTEPVELGPARQLVGELRGFIESLAGPPRKWNG